MQPHKRASLHTCSRYICSELKYTCVAPEYQPLLPKDLQFVGDEGHPVVGLLDGIGRADALGDGLGHHIGHNGLGINGISAS